MGRKGESITLSLKEYEKQALMQLAREYGMVWGDRPNISKLLSAVAKKELLIAPNHDWSEDKIESLNRIRKILVDVGKIDEAKIIARILADRSEINNPLRHEIEQFLSQEIPSWRRKIDNCIKRQQPFKLIYQDASDRFWEYTVLYARVEFIEKRFYLLCRCEETEGNNDIEELKHNWIFRLDRIHTAELIEINRQWEDDLQRVPVEFHLFDRLVYNYESKPEDIEEDVALIPENRRSERKPCREKARYYSPYKKVIRNVFSTFWFFRDIAKYWENCEIISPENFRQEFIKKLQQLNRNYQSTLPKDRT